MAEENDEVTAVKEVSEPLNIKDLKEMNIQALAKVAKDLNIGGATGMRKQDLIFQILKAQTEQSGLIFSEGVLKRCRTASDFCGRLITTTFQVRTTFTFPPRKSENSTCTPGIRFQGRSARPRTASGILP